MNRTDRPEAGSLAVANGQPTLSERAAAGRAARSRLPRSVLGRLEPPPDRDPVALLEQQAATRVAELVPIRYGRMLDSPFALYRGGALVMARDLAATAHTGLTTQLCGDAHLTNFGLFASPERRLVFDLNDFDETFRGPFEWDVKRLAASLEIAGRGQGLAKADRRRIVLAGAARYRTAMNEFARLGNLAVWYTGLDITAVQSVLTTKLKKTQRGRLARYEAKARTRDSDQALGKLAAVVDGEYRIVSAPPLVVPMTELLTEPERKELAAMMEDLLDRYAATLSYERRQLLRAYRLVDIARKVVGVGSVGTRAWILLLLGHDRSDPLFLQAKEAQPSVLEGLSGPRQFANQGERVVTGQRLMQAASDIFLGWQRTTGTDGVERDFYVRQLRDWKGSFEIEDAVAPGMLAYAETCGWTLARAHARGGGDRVAIAAYLGRSDAFDRAVAEFAESYADLNEGDYQALVAAERSGRIVATVGV
jgi:uncharacterized protein (DUF2252 family)